MTNNIVPLHRRAVPVPSGRPSSSPDPVRVTFDDARGVHVAVCTDCAQTESAYHDELGWLLDWADAHECDRELVELFAEVCGRRAA